MQKLILSGFEHASRQHSMLPVSLLEENLDPITSPSVSFIVKVTDTIIPCSPFPKDKGSQIIQAFLMGKSFITSVIPDNLPYLFQF